MTELSTPLFIKLRDHVYARTGLFFDERKRYFFARRLERRMEVTGAESILEYFQSLVNGNGKGEAETIALAEALTTNETYFFREYPQLQTFAEDILQDVLEQKRKADDWTLSVWCAGCSTGEEAYTLAIILREMIEDFSRWKITLVASDLNREVLSTAQQALYGERSVKDVPTIYLDRYFRSGPAGYRVSPQITSMVDFRHGNLMDGDLAAELNGLDFVFCRNVLIYFDDDSRRSVVDSFYGALRPGGYIFLGHSESVGRITSSFRLVRQGGMLSYTK